MNRISSNTNFNTDARDYQRVEQAIAYIIEHRVSQPELEDVAANIGLSPFHTQRLFSRWAGVSPKRFLSYLTVEHAKQKLEESVSVLDAALDIGLSGPSRLYDLMVSVEAMTPGEYKTQGSDIVISYGQALTPFGAALLLVSDRGLCGLEFFTDDFAVLLDTAKARWPLSYFEEDQSLAKEMASRIFSAGDTVPILMKGTSWQLQVWSALLRVPPGVITSYGQIAENLCTKKASRAVGTAVAANHIGYVVPCHRVLRATGMFKRYRWGAPRRWAMLAKESAEH
ncbi:MAG: methylated-DNA--[protein]-cysteine S-methyltransferase [Rhodospirillaceae bacterium]|jgi:AraC family transcriptional regulator, regulatory protein of adaptative response / methylated-DNA-[protein]-cysteine methyltransferase